MKMLLWMGREKRQVDEGVGNAIESLRIERIYSGNLDIQSPGEVWQPEWNGQGVKEKFRACMIGVGMGPRLISPLGWGILEASILVRYAWTIAEGLMDQITGAP